MGVLVDGQWKVEGFEARADQGGAFQRSPSHFRDQILRSESEQSGKSRGSGARYAPEAGRYHLYASKACPWAHRTLIMRALKGLHEAISVSIVDPVMGDEGWHFSSAEGCIPDSVNGARYLRELYVLADPHANGPVTVPVLWDKHFRTIVNNESSEIIRMLNSEFVALSKPTSAGLEHFDFYPERLREPIDAINEKVYDHVNNGVYLCGFARSQAVYERSFESLFATLDELDRLLGEQPYLIAARFTEADLRLFTTLFRFDTVYHGHFKCNRRRLIDYKNLWDYTRMIYQIPGIKETCDLNHIKTHYYRSHPNLNPSGIIPLGPDIDLDEPHDRPSPMATATPPAPSNGTWSATAPHISHGI